MVPGKRLKVMNPGLGRSGEADCIAVYGLMEMASYSRLIGGTYGYRSDQDGCLISSGLAMELFGGLDVAGKIHLVQAETLQDTGRHR